MHVDRIRRAQPQSHGTGFGDDVAAVMTHERRGETELEARDELTLHRHRAAQPFDGADEGLRRPSAHITATSTRLHRQRVDHPHLTARRRDHGFVDQAVGKVAAADLVAPLDLERPVARSLVEEPAEHGWLIGTRRTPPVDRSRAGRQRRRMTVGEESVVTDPRFAHLRLLVSSDPQPPTNVTTRTEVPTRTRDSRNRREPAGTTCTGEVRCRAGHAHLG